MMGVQVVESVRQSMRAGAAGHTLPLWSQEIELVQGEAAALAGI
jgi:hypothetical protein